MDGIWNALQSQSQSHSASASPVPESGLPDRSMLTNTNEEKTVYLGYRINIGIPRRLIAWFQSKIGVKQSVSLGCLCLHNTLDLLWL